MNVEKIPASYKIELDYHEMSILRAVLASRLRNRKPLWLDTVPNYDDIAEMLRMIEEKY